MRYIYACFKGYIGFYNGSNLEKLEIDFTKCKNNIILICGRNGSGKSTLLNALNIFPDSNSDLIPNMNAEKILRLFENGDTYDIDIVYPCDAKGSRKQTKAFIKKNGLELNENGNITSYKEILFSEFDLDSNYVTLSKLSNDDRGLADKSPSERKKFVSSIIDNLEVYNDIYKTLNKKSLIFKSHINTLHTKIQNIGNKENLEITLNSLRKKEEEIKSRILNLNNQIVAIEAKNSIDEEESSRIAQLDNEYNILKSQLESIKSNINVFKNKTKIKEEDIESKYNEDSILLNHYNQKIAEYKSSWIEKSNRLVDINKSINDMNAEIDLVYSNIDKKIEQEYELSNKNLNRIISELKELNFTTNTDCMNNIDNILEEYDLFVSKIDILYQNSDSEMIQFITLNYDKDILSKLNSEQEKYRIELNNIVNNITTASRELEIISILDKKPDNCKLYSCPFISEASELKKNGVEKESHIKYIDKLKSDHENVLGVLSNIESDIEKYGVYIAERMKLDIVIDSFLKTTTDFNKLGEVNIDRNQIYELISNNNNFNFMRDPKRFRIGYNLLEELKGEQERNKLLKIQYQSFRDKIGIINSTNNMIDKLKDDVEKLSIEVSENKKNLDNMVSLKESLETKIQDEAAYYKLYSDYKLKEKDLKNISDQLDTFKKKSSKALEQISYIKGFREEINRLNNECNPVSMDIQRISGQLALLDSYYIEYNQYKEKYDMIEVLKKYCSPTGGGIQTLFMQLYMAKTLELSNQVLGMLFGGSYQLLDFVINQSEFRIPFIGEGLPVDDISSGSSSQISMMGMVINLVLLFQASTKFNIARLDEMDDSLDNKNRIEFVNILLKIIQMLNIDQLFIISHSIEVDSSFADIIKLKGYDDFEYNNFTGNIIYDYNHEINKTYN